MATVPAGTIQKTSEYRHKSVGFRVQRVSTVYHCSVPNTCYRQTAQCSFHEIMSVYYNNNNNHKNNALFLSVTKSLSMTVESTAWAQMRWEYTIRLVCLHVGCYGTYNSRLYTLSFNRGTSGTNPLLSFDQEMMPETQERPSRTVCHKCELSQCEFSSKVHKHDPRCQSC